MLSSRGNRYLLLLSALLVFISMVGVLLLMFQNSASVFEHGLALFFAGLCIHYLSLSIGVVFLILRVAGRLKQQHNFYYCFTGVCNLMIFIIYLLVVKDLHAPGISFPAFAANLLVGTIMITDLVLD